MLFSLVSLRSQYLGILVYILLQFPQSLMIITPCGLCRSSIFLSFRLGRNLSSRFWISQKDSRQAGMTMKPNVKFSDALRSLPQGIHKQHKKYSIAFI